MRRKRDGTRYFMDLSAQEQAEVVAQEGKYQPPTPREAWLNLIYQALGDVDYFAPKLKVNEALPVVTARAALRLLIEFLERNK